MKHITMLLLCLIAMSAKAQRLTHDFQGASLSEALIWIDNAQDSYKLNFIFDELEDFTVTTSLNNVSVRDAVRQVCGFYPMHLTFDEQDIYIECIQKETQKVIGRVIDEQGHPIEYANISLLRTTPEQYFETNPTYVNGQSNVETDGAFINGGVSNENGDFVIPCKARQVILKVSYIGYKTVTRNISVGHIGTITLQPETYMVKGVEIKGEIPQYKTAQGGLTVDVQHSILHDVGTADDLLSMMPMIQGRNGKFEVLAKGEPEIYINNKKVRDPSELKQLKSVDIKSVDIITAPGARYNAEVNAVVRIKTLKAQGQRPDAELSDWRIGGLR